MVNFFLFGILICLAMPANSQSFKTKAEADAMLGRVEAIQPGNNRFDTLVELLSFYRESRDSLKYTVVDMLRNSANASHDNNYWARYYYERSYLETMQAGVLYLLTIDSAYAKAKVAGNFELIVRVISERAMYLLRNNRLQEALDDCITAIQLSEEHHFKQFLPYRYMTASMVYKLLGDTARQYEMSIKACDAANVLNDLEAKAHSTESLASFLVQKKEYGRAIELSKLSIKWFEQLKLRFNVACGRLSIANAYIGNGQFDTAKQYAKSSLAHFSMTQNTGLMEDANATLANIYEKLNIQDSAIYFYEAAIALGRINNNTFGNVYYHKSLSGIYLKKKNYQKAAENLQLYTMLHDSIVGIEKNKAIEETSVKYETKKKNNDIIILNKDKALQEQLLSRQKLVRNILIFGILLILLLGVLFFKRMRLQKKLDRQQAISIERERIISDLHDDVGATLSSIHIYGDLAENVWHSKPEASKEMVGQITQQAKDLMAKMGDIIWSMKPVTDEKSSFTAKLKNFSSELLSPKKINCHFDIDESVCEKIINPLARKNILLIIKEAMNNIAKYSEADRAAIAIRQMSDRVLLTITDNGNGFDTHTAQNGNGLGNMKQRCEQLQGIFTLEPGAEKGVVISCNFPMTIFSHKE